jgi:hypothetical protein
MEPAQKTVDLHDHLKGFQEFKAHQTMVVHQQNKKDEIEKKRIQEDIRKINLNKLQRNMAFIDDWHQKGLENWQANMEKFHLREKLQEEF